MPAYFLDTSALVKRYLVEPGTPAVVSLTNPVAGHQLYVCRITFVEAVAAIARRVKGGRLTAADATRIVPRVRNDFFYYYALVSVSSKLLTSAGALAERHALRGYDAVQLAAAVAVTARLAAADQPPRTFVCSDRELNAVAVAEGLPVLDPAAGP